MRIIFTLFLLFQLISAFSQANGYGIRAGYGLSFQKWQGGSGRDPLLAPHVDVFMDSESENGNILYGALGYHLRGSEVRFGRFVDLNGNVYSGGGYAMKFHQVGLELGLKKTKSAKKWKIGYGVGIRGEYTVKSKFEIFETYKSFVNKFNYGFTVCGSTEKKLNKFVSLGFEVRVSPDVSRQIFVQAGTLYYDPYTNSATPGPEQSIRNISLEAGLYIRFLQLIEYIE